MTWFEVEQIDSYLEGLEKKLDKWRLDPPQMRSEKIALERLHQKLRNITLSHKHMTKVHFLQEFSTRIKACELQIEERLKR